MKNYKLFSVFIVLLTVAVSIMSCSSSNDNAYAAIKKQNPATLKSGAQLWGENCIRCHNTPSPASYNDTDWKTIELHMRVRANLTKDESKKIFEFLRSAN